MCDIPHVPPTAESAGITHKHRKTPPPAALNVQKYTKHPLRHFYSILSIIRFQNPRTPMISKIDTQRAVKGLLRGCKRPLRGTPRGCKRLQEAAKGYPKGLQRAVKGPLRCRQEAVKGYPKGLQGAVKGTPRGR
jgi:hypothetical protein